MSRALPEAFQSPRDAIFIFYFVLAARSGKEENHGKKEGGNAVRVRREPRPTCVPKRSREVGPARAMEVWVRKQKCRISERQARWWKTWP